MAAFSGGSDTFIVNQIRDFLESSGRAESRKIVGGAMNSAKDRLAKTLDGMFELRAPRDPANLKLYPSEAGKCARAIQYKALGIPGEPMSSDVSWKLAMGNMLELALVYVISSIPTINVSDNNALMQVEIGGELWRGASDGVITTGTEKRNVEVKSTSGIGFKMTLSKGIDNAFGYLTQSSVYMRQMLKDGTINVPETVFVYLDRDSMKMAEFVVKYDKRLAEEADAKFVAIAQAVTAKKMVQRGYELDASGGLALQCGYCPHKHTCWTQPHQVITFEGGKPEYKTKPERLLQLVMAGKKPKWFLV
jgi:hypothetical protein